jgi:threonine/homoserine/homoserine lactone efflux protein
MVDVERLAAFALVALVIISIPGPSVLFVVSRGIALGRKAAVATAVGNEAGLGVQVVAVAFGLGAIVERSVLVFTIIKLAGACYLAFLGVRAIRRRADLSAAIAGRATAQRSWALILREGFVVGLTNPKGIALFTAILPQFVDVSRGHAALQMLVLGLVAVSIALASDSMWGVLAGTARTWLGRSPRRLRLMGGTAGVIMIGLGARLALSGPGD